MRKLRLYLDSPILGWSLNHGNPSRFAEANLLLQQIADGRFIGVYSWVSRKEIEAAPKHIAKKLWQKVEHIVSLETMVAVNEVNKALNLNKIFLCQPQEVIISGH